VYIKNQPAAFFSPNRLRSNATYVARTAVCISVSVCLSLCACMLGTRVSCAKNVGTDGDAIWATDSRGPKEPCIIWGSRSPRKGAHFRGHVLALCSVPTHECLTHCSPAPRANMHSPPRGMTSRRCGLLPNYFGHLLFIVQQWVKIFGSFFKFCRIFKDILNFTFRRNIVIARLHYFKHQFHSAINYS